MACSPRMTVNGTDRMPTGSERIRPHQPVRVKTCSSRQMNSLFSGAMNFIPPFIRPGDQNPLNQPDGQARVLNVILGQLCLLRAEVGAVQGTLFIAGDKLGLKAG